MTKAQVRQAIDAQCYDERLAGTLYAAITDGGTDFVHDDIVGLGWTPEQAKDDNPDWDYVEAIKTDDPHYAEMRAETFARHGWTAKMEEQ